MKRVVFAAFALVCLEPIGSTAMPIADPAAKIEVDVALVLAVDASSSMDDGERRLQRDGYAAALTSPSVMEAIEHGSQHRIAVLLFEWGSRDKQVVIAPWQIVDGPATAQKLAQLIAETPSQDLQRTSISAALDYAGTMLVQSGFKAEREVIDVSGDGPNNDGIVVSDARDKIVARGISINGLPIVKKSTVDIFSIPDLDQYYQHCVIGGEGSFMIPVEGMANFSKALEMKLVMEIAGLPQAQPRAMPVMNRDWSNCHIYE